MKRKYLTLIGTALTLALTANVAITESASSVEDIKLSPEALKILCEQSPLNSRCPNGTPITPTEGADSPTQPEGFTTPESGMPNSPTQPEGFTTPESGMPNSPTQPEGFTTPEPGMPLQN